VSSFEDGAVRMGRGLCVEEYGGALGNWGSIDDDDADLVH